MSTSDRSAVVLPSRVFKGLFKLHINRLLSLLSTVRVDYPLSYLQKTAGIAQWLATNTRHARLYTSSLLRAAELVAIGRAPSEGELARLIATLSWWTKSAAAGRLIPHRFIRGIDIPSFTLVTSHLARGADVAFSFPVPVTRDAHSRRAVFLLVDAAGLTAVGGCWRSSGDEGQTFGF